MSNFMFPFISFTYIGLENYMCCVSVSKLFYYLIKKQITRQLPNNKLLLYNFNHSKAYL